MEIPDTVILSPGQYALASTKRLANTETTALEFFLKKSVGVKAADHWHRGFARGRWRHGPPRRDVQARPHPGGGPPAPALRDDAPAAGGPRLCGGLRRPRGWRHHALSEVHALHGRVLTCGCASHTACIDGVQPGDVGEWDDAHPSVRIWLRAGLLVPVPAPPRSPRCLRSPPGRVGRVTRGDLRRIHRRAAGFAAVPEAQITAAITSATRRCSAAHFGADLDDAVSLYAAHLLSLSSFGKPARKADDGVSSYLIEWKRLARARWWPEDGGRMTVRVTDRGAAALLSRARELTAGLRVRVGCSTTPRSARRPCVAPARRRPASARRLQAAPAPSGCRCSRSPWCTSSAPGPCLSGRSSARPSTKAQRHRGRDQEPRPRRGVGTHRRPRRPRPPRREGRRVVSGAHRRRHRPGAQARHHPPQGLLDAPGRHRAVAQRHHMARGG